MAKAANGRNKLSDMIAYINGKAIHDRWPRELTKRVIDRLNYLYRDLNNNNTNNNNSNNNNNNNNNNKNNKNNNNNNNL